jgi:dipeptidyl aminopeptidase/acylaminoacyl peptidase
LEGDRGLRAVLATAADESDPRLSPDGGWIAYASDDAGRFEVYVVPFPGPGGRFQVSTDGGSAPVWSRDGKELFFVSGGRLMAAAVETRPAFRAELPRALLELPDMRDYDVAPDGQRFLVARWLRPRSAPRTLAVVIGWSDEVARRVDAT